LCTVFFYNNIFSLCTRVCSGTVLQKHCKGLTLCQHQEKIFRQHFIPEDVYFIFRRYFTKEFSLLYISVPKDEWYSSHANLLQTERSQSDYRKRYNGIFIKVCPTLLGLYNCAHANGDSEGIEANITHYVVSSCAYRVAQKTHHCHLLSRRCQISQKVV